MNILLISQCSKNALTETRRIIDQFAERKGDCVWQTAITQQGLDALKKLLKKTARRNTAVACYWIRAKNQTELLWLVGNARYFNQEGSVPTQRTQRDILRQQDENDWQTGQWIQILAALAALFHDFGKSSVRFQHKLKAKSKQKQGDAFRHEWVSLRLFQAFIGQDAQNDVTWLTQLSTIDKTATQTCLERLYTDALADKSQKRPLLDNLPPLAQAVAWLIVSHHRMPRTLDNSYSLEKLSFVKVSDELAPEWNDARPDVASQKELQENWQFKDEILPFHSDKWQQKAQYWAKKALMLIPQNPFPATWHHDPLTYHLARLSLMIADHFYSSGPAHLRLGSKGFRLYANTDKITGKVKQQLDEHLCGVTHCASQVARTLPYLSAYLPRLARHNGLTKRSADPRFRWQDKAYDIAVSLRHLSEKQGFFGVNMASTGCGKTFANARIMYGLSHPDQGCRFTIALGLRTLTLQTGEALRQRLHLDDTDLAVLMGSSAVRELFELNKVQEEKQQAAEQAGSESAESLLPDNSHIHYEGVMTQGALAKWFLQNQSAKAMLSAPILSCTVDRLIGATENLRGGKQIIPMLRLMTGDLILDEPDEFSMSDLPALTRLVHWAGVLGSRVLLSSATLQPAMLRGLFQAYQAGRKVWAASRSNAVTSEICCAWFDEYTSEAAQIADVEQFKAKHQQFTAQRVVQLAQKPQLRQAQIQAVTTVGNSDIPEQLAPQLLEMMTKLHLAHYQIDPKTGKKISVGLVRFANIEPLITIAKTLFAQDAPADYKLVMCCYHSHHLLLTRSRIEASLDRLLARHQPDAIFEQPEIRTVLDSSTQTHLVFVVLSSPVEEVGRDHDFDWAVVEPSSMRSIIQLAGRIRRHRQVAVSQPNIFLLANNIRSLKNKGQSASYCYPGFETEKMRLTTHHLPDLLPEVQYRHVNAISRITEPDLLDVKQSAFSDLVDLEHAVMHNLFFKPEARSSFNKINAWWETSAHITGILQRKSRFRANDAGRQSFRYFLGPKDEEDENGRWVFYDPETFDLTHFTYQTVESYFVHESLFHTATIVPWHNVNYQQDLIALAAKLNVSLMSCAAKFGWVELSTYGENQVCWGYHPVLGFYRHR